MGISSNLFEICIITLQKVLREHLFVNHCHHIVQEASLSLRKYVRVFKSSRPIQGATDFFSHKKYLLHPSPELGVIRVVKAPEFD